MVEVPISKFKATCLAVLERVRTTGEPVLVTRFGHPVAEINRPRAAARKPRKLGQMEGTGKILGDLVAPPSDESDGDIF